MKKARYVELAGELVARDEVAKLGLDKLEPAGGVDLKTLTEKAPDPFFVYVRAGRTQTQSGNKRRWSEAALKKFVTGLPLYGYRGHREMPTGTSYMPYREFVTVWVAGKMVDGVLYLKGWVPPAETDLKEQIQISLATGKPMQVSPWGLLLIERASDGVPEVVDADPRSIDWAPPGDAGFEDAEVLKVAGETQAVNQEDQMEEQLKKLQDEVARLGGELKTVQAQNEALTAKNVELGGEVKKFQEAEATAKKAAVTAHRTTLLGQLEEPVREVAGEMLKGDSVEELNTSFETVKGRLAKLTPGLKIIGGETKKTEAEKDPHLAD